ncbi:hypothetical protein [Pleurocapsa sp. FMAR1]|uniref:hypothetical protein n=1 Tax=Pleurocapsa sp. FMAR1 TaxID=3040204 RepID=UPI0029C8F196|nr:hypothetical protein [Pleurocapsa sp. FMAR1]
MNNTDDSLDTLAINIGGSGIKAMVLNEVGNSISRLPRSSLSLRSPLYRWW